MTEFISDVINVNNLHFTFDGNSKITASNGTFASPKPNAFSLIQIRDCPGHTPVCSEACYVHGLEKHAPAVHKAYRRNSASIRLALTQDWKPVVRAFADWINANCKEFRWHVSGDIFSQEYARFIAEVCYCAQGVQFWTYTRSFWWLSTLAEIPNLVVNLSADQDNYKRAVEAAEYYSMRLCYLTRDGTFPPDLPLDSIIFPDYALRGRDLAEPTEAPWWKGLSLVDRKKVCPVDFFGQSETLRCGPCNKCLVPFKP